MRVLVLTSEPIDAGQLRRALGAGQDESPEVMVVAPAFNESGLRFWTADADEAIARAEKVRRQTANQLAAEDVSAQGDSGESDPLLAIQDALQTFAAEKIVVFRHPEGEQRYREDFDLDAVRERFGLPVEESLVSAD